MSQIKWGKACVNGFRECKHEWQYCFHANLGPNVWVMTEWFSEDYPGKSHAEWLMVNNGKLVRSSRHCESHEEAMKHFEEWWDGFERPKKVYKHDGPNVWEVS